MKLLICNLYYQSWLSISLRLKLFKYETLNWLDSKITQFNLAVIEITIQKLAFSFVPFFFENIYQQVMPEHVVMIQHHF